MQRRLFPRFVYTRPFGWALAVSTAILLVHALLGVRQGRVAEAILALPFGFALAWLLRELLSRKPFLSEPTPKAATAAKQIPYTAYLVATIDTRDMRIARARFCSHHAGASATTIHEHNVDIDAWDAETPREALEFARRRAPVLYPWLAPLLRKSGDLPQ